MIAETRLELTVRCAYCRMKYCSAVTHEAIPPAPDRATQLTQMALKADAYFEAGGWTRQGTGVAHWVCPECYRPPVCIICHFELGDDPGPMCQVCLTGAA